MNAIDAAKLIDNEMAGKNAAIHAYDTMIWKVHAGFLTLVFGAWGLAIKAAIEANIPLLEIKDYLLLLAAFSIMLSISAYLIDRNYARRKFRVIHAVNELIELMTATDLTDISPQCQSKLGILLKISGDAANPNYKSPAFTNEMTVSRIIYLLPTVLTFIIILFYIINNWQ